MNNKEIYKKTLTFSIRHMLWDTASLVVVIVMGAAGFILAEKLTDKGLIGLAIGIFAGIVIVAIVSHFISYIFKAGQIAMMTEAITKGSLPEDVYGAGKKVVKERFATVAAYYAVTSVIKGIFTEIGRGISALGRVVGGDAGNAVGDTISSAIQTIVSYLCDCCLGWVFYRKDKSAAKATLEGAVLFFKKGKALVKNLGRMFGMSLLSFVVIGGVFFGIFYLITMAFPGAFADLAAEIANIPVDEGSDSLDFLTNPQNLQLFSSAICAIVMWSFIQTTFVRPFILVGVLRNFIEAGKEETFTEADIEAVSSKSKKLAKLCAAE